MKPTTEEDFDETKQDIDPCDPDQPQQIPCE